MLKLVSFMQIKNNNNCEWDPRKSIFLARF